MATATAAGFGTKAALHKLAMRPSGLSGIDRRFDALAESAPDAILTIDDSSIILSANAAVERIFEYTPEELIGRSLTTLVPERMRAAHDAGIARYLRTGRRNIPWTGVQLPALTKSGQEVPVEISFGEFVDENGRHVFSGFVRDISERVRQEREVLAARTAADDARAAAERALRELTTLARITDVALAQRTFEEMLVELLRRLREELRTDEATVLLLDDERRELAVRASDGMHTEVDFAIRIPIGRGVAGEVAATGRPLIIEDLSGREVLSPTLRDTMTSLAAIPVRSAGETIGVLHVGSRQRRIFTDGEVRILEVVAERMAGVFVRTRIYEAERRARAAAEAAQAALADREAELRRVNAELEAAVRSRDEVLSIVSHDLRNPVSTISMSVALLQDAALPLDDRERRQQLEVIARSAQRTNRLIHDLLDVARIEGRRLTISARCEDPAALAAEACDAFRPIVAEKSQTLACEIAADLPDVYADRDRILQALANFLNNAVKFTPGGGRIVVRVDRGEAGGVVYSVSDSGPGIPLEEQSRLFTRFWQAKQTASMGSGLGLSIAKGIAEAHRGRVWAESKPGAGSTFYLLLPRSDECE